MLFYQNIYFDKITREVWVAEKNAFSAQLIIYVYIHICGE